MHFTQNHMVRRPVFASLLIFFIVCIAVSSASPQLPCEFYGPVTINGAPAPVGTVISAFVNNVKQGSIDVKETGRFGGIGTFDERLIVLSGENDFTGGAPMITFKIGDKVADQTSQYAPGTSTELSLSVGGAAAVVTPAPVNEQQPTLMSAASVAPVAPTVPTIPVVTVIQTPVPAPVVPVVTSTPAPQNGVSILTVSTPVPTPVVQVNQTPAPQIQQNASPTATPAPATPIVIPVVTAAPTPVSTPAGNVTATPAQTVIPTVVPTPVSNQTPANITNVTATSGNASVSVSFPSGQSVS